MPLLGKAILVVIALVLTCATPLADFNRRHVFHPGWPAHARYHCAAQALLNMGCGALSLALLLTAGPGDARDIGIAALLLGWSGATQLLAALIPGVRVSAEGGRLALGVPLAIWSTLAYLIMDLLGAWLALR